jgi:hypothetical protein
MFEFVIHDHVSHYFTIRMFILFLFCLFSGLCFCICTGLYFILVWVLAFKLALVFLSLRLKKDSLN